MSAPRAFPEGECCLARRLAQGDETVLADILRELGPPLERRLRKRFPRLASLLEDVLVEALYRLWQARGSYDPARGSLSAWFCTIASNHALDLLRVRRRRSDHETQLKHAELIATQAPAYQTEPAPPPPSAEEDDLADILERLPEQDRRIVLRYAATGGEGNWAAELAEELGVPAGTIRVKRLRILGRIRKQLGERGHSVGP